MNFQAKTQPTPLQAIMIGDESLVAQCAEIWQRSGHEVALLITRSADIATWAKEHGVRHHVYKGSLKQTKIEIQADWLFSIANLQIIPQDLLDAATNGAVNFHDGPLPKYAGLNAPVWAKLNGETQHGITWHFIEGDIDEGDILVQRDFEIAEGDTAFSLNAKCFGAAVESFPDVVKAVEAGGKPRFKQDLIQRSYFELGRRPDMAARLDFTKTTTELLNMINALDHGNYFNPICTAKIAVGNDVLTVGAAEADPRGGQVGQVIEVNDDRVVVATADGAIALSGLAMQTGEPFDLKRVNVGDMLSAPKNAARLNDVTKAIAKKEEFWRDALSEFEPSHLPLIGPKSEQADWGSIKIDLSGDLSTAEAVSAIGITTRASGAENTIQIALVTDAMTQLAGYTAPWVPFRFGFGDTSDIAEFVQSTEKGLSTSARKDTFALDLVGRMKTAGQPVDYTAPDVAIVLDDDAGPIDDVALNFMLSDGRLRLRFDQARVDQKHAERLVARLQLIAGQLSSATDLNELTVLPEAERKELLESWNQTEVSVDFDKTIHAAIQDQAQDTPDEVAVVFEHDTLTYAELDARTNQVAHVLQDMGVKSGDVVGVHCKRSIDLVVACIGAMKAGAAYLPLDPGFPADRLAIYVEDSRAKFIISQSAISGDLPASDATVLQIDTDERIKQASTDALADTAKGEDLAYLIFTSGSTGRPKGVMVEHRNVTNFFAGMDKALPASDKGTWMAVTSLSFDISVLELFYTLSRGFKLVISGDESATQISNGPIGKGAGGIDFSLYYWGNDDGVGPDKYKTLLEGAKFADENGFCAVWTPERHFHAFGGPYPNPSVTGAAVAGFTKNIGVRAGSIVAPLHHTARIAEEWSVIDNLTNGRAGLAIASGWQPDDFVLRPENTPPENKTAMFEQIRDLRKLWKGEAVEFPRKDGSMLPVVTQPRPMSKEPKLWVTTAGNPETWKEAGRNGANVLTHLLGQSIEEVAEKTKLYHEALRESGYDPKDYGVTLMLHTFVGDDRETVREIAREPMKDYLRSAAGLIKQYAWAFPAFKKPEGVKNAFQLDLGSLSEEELEGILDFAFLRYFEDSGLFGTVEECIAKVEHLKSMGISEVACLIDYGIKPDLILAGLEPLAEVVKACNREVEIDEADVSIAAQIMRHDVTHLQCTPSMARMLTMNTEAAEALGQVDHLMIGGEALPGALVQELNGLTDATITNMYGPTETTIWSSTATAVAGEGTVNIGRPIANTSMFIVDENMQPVPLGVPGELLIGGDGVTRGYWERDDLTADRFVSNPFGEGRLYRTGDLVRGRLDGGMDFIGRADHQVKLRGYRIELGEIESHLEDLKGVAQAVVIPREDNPGDVRLVAYIRGAAQETVMRDHLAEHVPDYMVPSHFVTLDSFPLTPNKKVDRKALPKPQKRVVRAPAKADAKPVAANTQAPSDVANQVANLWSRILGVEGIGASDNFFDLGGHSLLAVQAHRELRDVMGYSKLAITDIFRFPVLSGLVDRIEKLHGLAAAPAKLAEPAVEKVAVAPAESTQSATPRQDAMMKRRALRARRREKQL